MGKKLVQARVDGELYEDFKKVCGDRTVVECLLEAMVLWMTVQGHGGIEKVLSDAGGADRGGTSPEAFAFFTAVEGEVGYGGSLGDLTARLSAIETDWPEDVGELLSWVREQVTILKEIEASPVTPEGLHLQGAGLADLKASGAIKAASEVPSEPVVELDEDAPAEEVDW